MITWITSQTFKKYPNTAPKAQGIFPFRRPSFSASNTISVVKRYFFRCHLYYQPKTIRYKTSEIPGQNFHHTFLETSSLITPKIIGPTRMIHVPIWIFVIKTYIGVSKNRDTPKWMVYYEKPYQNGWFGGTLIFGNTHILGKNKIIPAQICAFGLLMKLVSKNLGLSRRLAMMLGKKNTQKDSPKWWWISWDRIRRKKKTPRKNDSKIKSLRIQTRSSRIDGRNIPSPQ